MKNLDGRSGAATPKPMAPQKKPLSALKPRVYSDVVDLLGQLHELAKAGDVTGVIIGARLRGHHYITDVVGTCHRDATQALGMAGKLTHDLNAILSARGTDETR